MEQFLFKVRERPIDAAKKLVDVMQYKAETCKNAIASCSLGHSHPVML